MQRSLALLFIAASALAGCDWISGSPTEPCSEARQLHYDAVAGAPVGTFVIREAHDDVIIDGGSKGTNGAFYIEPSTPPVRHTIGYRIGICYSVTVVIVL